MFVNIKKLAVVSTITALALTPLTANADTAKSQAILVDNTVTYAIAKEDQYVTKDNKHLLGHGVKYNGPTEAFFINGIN